MHYSLSVKNYSKTDTRVVYCGVSRIGTIEKIEGQYRFAMTPVTDSSQVVMTADKLREVADRMDDLNAIAQS